MSFQAKGDLADIHKQLLSDGLAFHTLVPQDGGATVYAAEIDPKNLQATVDAVRKAADRYGSKITYRHGRGEFIGDSLGTGSDREQRDRARAVYEDYIRRSPVYRSEAIWQGVRDNWSASADQAAKGLKAYDESQHPRGEHGRWTDAGGGSGGGKPDLLNPTGPANFQGVKAEVAMATSRVEDMFPSVPPSAIKIDGKDDPDYNCFAWACGATNQFWFPHRGYMYHWPAIEETTADDIDNFDVLFLDKLHGEEVVDQTYEPGFVKLALFTDTTEGEIYATHLSRQLPSGEWGSKLGSGYLVRHGTNIHDLDYGHYGNVEKIYKITEDAWEKLRTMK
jgi:hypothetical protein